MLDRGGAGAGIGSALNGDLPDSPSIGRRPANGRDHARRVGETPGVAYWVTGLPGAGKTTLARTLAAKLADEGRSVILLDGDRMRAIFGSRFGYAPRDRRALAQIYGGLCREISSQGSDVVCATVSMFHHVRAWNRANMPRYREIYLRAPIQVLARRHPGNLYAAGRAGRIRDVPGIDLAFEEPEAPDLIIDDDGSRTADAVAAELFHYLETLKEAA